MLVGHSAIPIAIVVTMEAMGVTMAVQVAIWRTRS